MNARVDHLLHAVLELLPEERNALAAALVDNLSEAPDSAISDAWKKELVARRDAYRAGKTAAADWHDIRGRLAAL